ncbi:MAG: secondary thiamine-phosphate synthase enzyme YjbQ [Candidatus Omnitrophota bacterium]|nr:YjbQ family protein [Candidatus Omnitrophota bacterium]MBU2528706.1 secondary thiamine-phosphate synthase enzyme YjbQ [bacterium]MBU3929403.1 secondary thiamine-phosphate synthase enzyme YjbQ [bacterium]MBU4123779.1 secondary thiamine-phosphate synthase enzyme YjbQ [bacterium]
MVKSIEVKTHDQTEMIDITEAVATAVRSSAVKEGTAFVFVPHTTAGVTINENADPDVKRDILSEMNKVIPFDDDYRHMEGNSAAHIKSSLFGPGLTVIISGGKLLLGTWQSIYFCEFDGPRNRRFYVKIQGD